MNPSVRIVYSRHYDIRLFGLERLHPFDTRKYGRAYRRLRHRFGRYRLRRITDRPHRPVSRDELLTVHTERYLKMLADGRYLSRALEVPLVARAPAWLVDRLVLRPMRWATAGTILGAQLAMRHGLAVNLSGGYHHASAERGEGFCVYADIALAIHRLRRDGSLTDADKIVFIDTDAHQGNGVCHDFVNDPRIFIYDQFNREIYPAFDRDAKRRIDCAVPLDSGCTTEAYLHLLERKLPVFLDSISRDRRVRFAIYNAGTDVTLGDPLGRLGVSEAAVLQRDQFVIQELVARDIPVLMLPSGGYTPRSAFMIAQSVGWIIETYTFPSRGD